jgi:hypothetical protein
MLTISYRLGSDKLTRRKAPADPPGGRFFCSVEELATRLKPHGVTENAASIANKLARGTFAAAFFLACLAALEFEGIRSEDI